MKHDHKVLNEGRKKRVFCRECTKRTNALDGGEPRYYCEKYKVYLCYEPEQRFDKNLPMWHGVCRCDDCLAEDGWEDTIVVEQPQPEPPKIILIYSLYIHLADKSWQYRLYATRTEGQIHKIAKRIMESDPAVVDIEIDQIETGDET